MRALFTVGLVALLAVTELCASSSDPAYDAAYSTQPQTIDTTPNTINTISFDINQVGSPKNITHPVLSDATKFRIEQSGTYLIGWTMTVSCNPEEVICEDFFNIELFNATTQQAINPNPFQSVDLFTIGVIPLFDSETFSGQTIVTLPAGTELQLRIISQPSFASGQVQVIDPTFFITKIADVEECGSSSSASSCSSHLDVAYDAAFTENLSAPQNIDRTTGSINPIIFATNKDGSPHNIVHPVGSDTTKFGIVESGTYLVGWTMTINNTSETAAQDILNVQLFDTTTMTAINPDPFQVVDLSFFTIKDSETISGQTIVFLPARTELQLRLIPQAAFGVGSLQVINPTFFIVQIDSAIASLSSAPNMGCDCSTSSSSSSSCSEEVAFDAAYNLLNQAIDLTIDTPTPVHFGINQVGSPENIVHPVAGDATKFGITEDGIYLVGWTMTISGQNPPAPGIYALYVQLFEATAQEAIRPDPFQIVDLFVSEEGLFDTETLSGQTIVKLTAGKELQVRLIPKEVVPGSGPIVVTDPTFFINRIADIP